jgi:3-oxoacyl-(acyl-carrier-protein) synthase
MRAALADAGVDASELGYVNAHATSTRLGDAAEARALELVLGDDHARARRSRRPRAQPVTPSAPPAQSRRSSPHWRSATASSRRRSTTTKPIPTVISTAFQTSARRAELELAASNSFGFGGHNATLVLRRYEA